MRGEKNQLCVIGFTWKTFKTIREYRSVVKIATTFIVVDCLESSLRKKDGETKLEKERKDILIEFVYFNQIE